jgi:hypothetical protein
VATQKDQPARRSIVGRLESNYAHSKTGTTPLASSTRPEGTDYPECQQDLATFERAETAVGKHIDRNRDLWSPDIDAADAIATHLGWCERCFMTTTCLTDMITVGYTGIAGGQFLYKGQIRTRRPQGKP